MTLISINLNRPLNDSDPATFATVARTLADLTGYAVEIRVYTPKGQFAFVQYPLQVGA